MEVPTAGVKIYLEGGGTDAQAVSSLLEPHSKLALQVLQTQLLARLPWVPSTPRLPLGCTTGLHSTPSLCTGKRRSSSHSHTQKRT